MVSREKVSEAVAVSSVEHVGTAAARGGGSRPRRECDSGNPRGARVAWENLAERIEVNAQSGTASVPAATQGWWRWWNIKLCNF